MKHLFFALLFLFSTQVVGGGQWVEDWWEGDYQNNVVPQQEQAQEQRSISRCERKIQEYQEKLNSEPKNSYYRWKLNIWTGKCE